jgi:signal transduction histidine kinase
MPPAASMLSPAARRLAHRAVEAALAVPVPLKVMGIALAVAAALGGGLLWQIHATWHEKAVRDVIERGEFLVRHVAIHAQPYLRQGRTEAFERLMGEVRTTAGDIVRLAVVDGEGRVVAQSGEPEGRGGVHVRKADLPPDLGGHVAVWISTEAVDRSVAWLTARLARTTAVVALVGLVASWGLARLFARPLDELVALAREIKAGQYGGIAPVRSGDEVGELAAAFNEMTTALAEKEREGRQVRRRVLAAQEDERRRIARELHDQTGQALTSLIAGLGALELRAPSPVTGSAVSELRRVAEETLEEVHDLAVALRPSVLDDVGLIPAVERHCGSFGARFDIAVSFRHIGMEGPRLPAEMEVAVYRVVQEALTNAARHGRARKAHVLLEREDDRVLLAVADDGQGFDADAWRADAFRGGHLGLRGMEERVHLFGGSFCVDSTPGEGVLIWAQLPLGGGA